MARYRTLWLWGWGAVALTCMGMGMLLWSLPKAAALFFVGAVVGGAAVASYYTRDGCKPMPRKELVAVVAAVGGAAGVVMVAVPALLVVAGPLALLVLQLAVATSPVVVAFVGRRFSGVKFDGQRDDQDNMNGRHRDDPTPLSPAVVEPGPALPAAVQTLTDKELCRVWRISFWALQSSRTPAAREQVVALRQAYLDELERRHPSALTAWLDSGARAASGPEKYLPDQQDGRHKDAS
jgi:hypothetical protein